MSWSHVPDQIVCVAGSRQLLWLLWYIRHAPKSMLHAPAILLLLYFPAQFRIATTGRARVMANKKAPVCVLCLFVSVSMSPSRWLVDRQVRLYFITCTVLGTTDHSGFQQLVIEHRGLRVARPRGTGLPTTLTCIPHS